MSEIPDLKEKMDPLNILAENAIQNQLIGKVIDGRFAVQSLLGTGATSSVYKAHDSEKQRTVAIKVLHEHLAANETLLSRFQREAKSAKIHRDLKPSNVILSTLADGSDFVKVLDFGSAQMSDRNF